jgi:P pilus assembly chaperone PapD
MKLRTSLRIVILTGVLWLGALLSEAVAIVVAPTAVYLGDGNPSAAVSLYNPSNQPEEVSVEAVFGYPTTDEEGNVYLHLDPDGEDARSAAGWIQALPRRLVVPPGERRTVRLLARPPAGTPDGEYWTRLILTASGQRIPSGGGADTPEVQVGLDLQVRTIISVAYRKGDVTTSVSVEDFAPEIRGDTLFVRPDLVRGGQGAFIGRMDLRLLDAAGAELQSWTEQVAVYRTYNRRYAYDVSALEPGSYRLVLRLGTERDDIPAASRLQAVPVEVTAEVVKR